MTEENMRAIIDAWAIPVIIYHSDGITEKLDKYNTSYKEAIKTKGEYSNLGISIKHITRPAFQFVDIIRTKDGMVMSRIHRNNDIVYNCPIMPKVLELIIKHKCGYIEDTYFN